MQSVLKFYGGAGSVTGSNFMLDTGQSKILIDCGLEQGMHEDKNWQPFAYNPSEVLYLLVTHAHVDHVGRIPFLVRSGFKGTILSTSGTRALAEPLLHDALELMEHVAQVYNLPPLYDKNDVEQALRLWQTTEYHKPQSLEDGVELTMLDAGHILGSAMMQLRRGGKTLVVTGDLGGGNSPLLQPAEKLEGVDYLVVESVYGNRARPEDAERKERLQQALQQTLSRGGTVLVPAFSTERTQDLLFEIRESFQAGAVPKVPVFLDSPLAQKITAAFIAHPQYFAPPIRRRVEQGEDIFAFPELVVTESAEESRRIAHTKGPKIILAGSGMSTGGRVLAHEATYLPDTLSTVLIVGYQAAGSVGRRLLEGEREVRIHGERVRVRARIESIFGYSAHMDSEALLRFVEATSKTLKQVFVVEGEPAAAAFLSQRLRDYVGVHASAPEEGDNATIEF